MRTLMQLAVLGLCLSTSFPAAAQFTGPGRISGLTPVVAPGLSGSGGARRPDPIVFMDRVTEHRREAVLHLSVYADGLVTVSRGSFRGDDAELERVDMDRVGVESVEALRRALSAAGAQRLLGVLDGTGPIETTHHVTFFRANPARVARPLLANSFSFAPTTSSAAARRVAVLLETFIQETFPGLLFEAPAPTVQFP